MKKNLIIGLALLSFAAVSCNKEASLPEGRGRILLSLSSDAGFKLTKALNEAEYKDTDSYSVLMTNSNGKEIMNCLGSEIEDNLPKDLEMGSYTIKASYGKEFAKSRDKFYVEGVQTIMLQPKETKTVVLNCLPTCGKVLVQFDPSMSTYYSAYSVTFGGTKALGSDTAVWAKNDTEPWYLALDAAGETVSYTLALTVNEDYQHIDAGGNAQKNAQVKGSFKLERNKAHKLTVKANYTPQTDGGMGLSVVIDDSTNEKPVTITVPVTWI